MSHVTVPDDKNVLSDGGRIAGNAIACPEEKHPRCCGVPGSARGVSRPGGQLGRRSERTDRETRSDFLQLNRRVRQEERHIVSAGAAQQSQ
jgi:hypothetical protein